METCVLTVERTTKEILPSLDLDNCLRIKPDNHVVYMNQRRMKDMKITAKNNLVLIKGVNSKIVVCQVEKISTTSATDYYSIYLNKLTRHNLGVFRGDIVTVQSCKNCPAAGLVEIGLFSNSAIKHLTL